MLMLPVSLQCQDASWSLPVACTSGCTELCEHATSILELFHMSHLSILKLMYSRQAVLLEKV